MRRMITAGLAATLVAVLAAGPAFANPPDLELKPGNHPGPGVGRVGPGFNGGGGRAQGFRRGGGGFGGNGYGGYRRHNGGYGAAVGAGVAGLAAGAILGGAIANQGYGYGYGYGDPGPGYYAPQPAPVYAEPEEADADPVAGDPTEYCASRYKSYDPRSGTYLGYDGDRHPCP